METYEGESKSYEEAKLNTLIAILGTMGIDVKDEGLQTKVYKDGELVATFDISL